MLKVLNSPEDAYKLLESLGASARLITHLKLVGEAADQLIDCLRSIGVDFNASLVQLGVACHDAGKIIYPQELDFPGTAHEQSGMDLLLKNDVQEDVARCCLSHGRYETMAVCYEELLVALADKLWKGKRVESLEWTVIEQTAKRLNQDRWTIFDELDRKFEQIAALGDERLIRSINHG